MYVRMYVPVGYATSHLFNGSEKLVIEYVFGAVWLMYLTDTENTEGNTGEVQPLHTLHRHGTACRSTNINLLT